MPVLADQRYHATVLHAACVENLKGTLGVELSFETQDGFIDHTMWITEKTNDAVEENFVRMGIDPVKLRTEEFYVNIDAEMKNRTCQIVTFLDTYNGDEKVKVKWINALRKQNNPSLAPKLARVMAGAWGAQQPAPASQPLTRTAESSMPETVWPEAF
jgi:hypothetical protein